MFGYLNRRMKMKIYCINNRHSIPKEISSCFMSLIDQDKLAKIKRYRNKKDFENALIADALVRFSILESKRIKYIKRPFLLNEYGKPHLSADINLQFNSSHSGDWVVCAVDEKAIGIDIELIKDADILEIAEGFFATEEYDQILDTDSNMRKELFYDIWTLKESYIKALGKGLSIKLNSFSILKANNIIKYKTQMQHEQCYFKQYDIDTCYKLSVCSFSNDFPAEVAYLEINDLYKSFIDYEKPISL
jgi:4'-phosphopantetheinyl transferase